MLPPDFLKKIEVVYRISVIYSMKKYSTPVGKNSFYKQFVSSLSGCPPPPPDKYPGCQ
jgi:hypothetical protein